MSDKDLPYPPPKPKRPKIEYPKKNEWKARMLGLKDLQMNEDGTFQVPEGDELWKVALRNFNINDTESTMVARWRDPAMLLELVCGYFNWLQENPLQEGKLVSYEGNSSVEDVPKMRAPTLQGLCLFIGINRHMWGRIRSDPPSEQIRNVVNFAEQYMYDAKFTGAAAGLLNPMLISKDLGLVEKTEVNAGVHVTITGKDGEL